MKKVHGDENPIIDNENKQETPESVSAGETSHQEAALPDAETSEATPEAKLEAELSEARDKYLRLYSEFENYKKRISRDRIEQSKMAGADLFLSILPVIDDLERALKSISEKDTVNSVKQGLQLIYSKFSAILDSRGLIPMDAVGKMFDPDLHDAIGNVDVEEKNKVGKVVEEIEKGYILNDRVIRHAKVIVGK